MDQSTFIFKCRRDDIHVFKPKYLKTVQDPESIEVYKHAPACSCGWIASDKTFAGSVGVATVTYCYSRYLVLHRGIDPIPAEKMSKEKYPGGKVFQEKYIW